MDLRNIPLNIPLSICVLGAGCSDLAAAETLGGDSTTTSDSDAPTSTTITAEDGTSSATSTQSDDGSSGPMPSTSEGPGTASDASDTDASTDASSTDASSTDSGEPVEPDELVFDTVLSHGPSTWVTSSTFDDAGHLYVLARSDESGIPLASHLTRFSDGDGGWTEDWTWTLPADVASLQNLALDDDDQPFLVGSLPFDGVSGSGAFVVAVDRDTGTTIGEPQVFPVPDGLLVYGYLNAVFDDAGDLVVGGYSQEDGVYSPEPVVAQIDPATATVTWAADLPESWSGFPRDLVRGDGTIFGISSFSGMEPDDVATHAFAVDPDDGVVLETYPLGMIEQPKFDRDAATGDFVVVGWNTGIGYYDDAFTQSWSSDVLELGSDVAFGDDGSIYATGWDLDGSVVVAVDPGGNLLWSDTPPDSGSFLLVDHHVDTLAVVGEVFTNRELTERALTVRIYEIP